MSASELTTSSVNPPAGAGSGPMLMGNAVDAPNATFNVDGVLIRLWVTTTERVPCPYPGALARRSAVPEPSPLTLIWPTVWPSAMKAVPGATTDRKPGWALVSVTVVPPDGAAKGSVTPTGASRVTPTTWAPISARAISFVSTVMETESATLLAVPSLTINSAV